MKILGIVMTAIGAVIFGIFKWGPRGGKRGLDLPWYFRIPLIILGCVLILLGLLMIVDS